MVVARNRVVCCGTVLWRHRWSFWDGYNVMQANFCTVFAGFAYKVWEFYYHILVGGGIWRIKECNPSVQWSFGNYSSAHLSLNNWAQCFPFDLAEACKVYTQKACWKFIENKRGCKHAIFCWLAKLNQLLPLSFLLLPSPLFTSLLILACVELSEVPINPSIAWPLQTGLLPSLYLGTWAGSLR